MSKPGGTSEHSCASSRPAKSLVYELPLLFTIPVSDPAESPGRVMIELLFFTRRHFATVSLRLSSKRSVLFLRNNALLGHAGSSKLNTPRLSSPQISPPLRRQLSRRNSGRNRPYGSRDLKPGSRFSHEVAVDFTIPGQTFPRNTFGSNDLSGVSYSRVLTQNTKPTIRHVILLF